MSIKQIFDEISSEPSSNKKLTILRKYKDNELLKNVLEHIFSPLIKYYIKDYAIISPATTQFTLAEAIEKLDEYIVTRKITGGAAKSFIEELSSSLNEDDQFILRKIIDGDARIGVSGKSINKVWSNLIKDLPYQRCSSKKQIAKIVFPAMAQRKADGTFANVVIKDDDIKFFTRNNNEFSLNCIKHDLLDSCHHNNVTAPVVVNGELVVKNADKSEKSRKEGNGLVSSLIDKEKTIESMYNKLQASYGTKRFEKLTTEVTTQMREFETTDNHLELIMWDVIPYEDWLDGHCGLSYKGRFESLSRFESSHVNIIESVIVNSLEEAMAFYEKQLEMGYEGAVLKNIDAEWKDGISMDMIKLVPTKTCELKATDINYGDKGGKYELGIGSIMFESSDGIVKVDVSGLSDAQRGFERVDKRDSSKGIRLIDGFDLNQYTGKIASIKFKEIIDAKNKDGYSLFHPRLGSFRVDKSVADDFEYIKSL